MLIKMRCECGAQITMKTEGNADQATVESVVIWIRLHSLHGEVLVGKKQDNK